MATVTVIDRSGREREIGADDGGRLSLMEVLRDHGVEGILAICGGCCSCSTCHVYVEDASLVRLPPMSADESDLLSGSDHCTRNSRLSCQIRFSPELDGIKVTVAPED